MSNPFRIIFKTIRKFVSVSLSFILLIPLLLLVISLSAGVYAYYSVPIKTIHLCVSNTTYDLNLDKECISDAECSEEIVRIVNSGELNRKMEEESENEKMANISLNIVSNLVDAVSEGAVQCVDNKCRGRGIENLDQLFSPESRECLPDEETKEIKICAKDIIPPKQLFTILKTALASKDFRAKIEEFIKTGNFSEK